MAKRQRPFITIINETKEEKANRRYMRKRRNNLLQLFQQYRDVQHG